MPVRMEADVKVWQRRDRNKQLAIWGGWFAGVLLFVYCWQIIYMACTPAGWRSTILL